jgi:hypothetical protein
MTDDESSGVNYSQVWFIHNNERKSVVIGTQTRQTNWQLYISKFVIEPEMNPSNFPLKVETMEINRKPKCNPDATPLDSDCWGSRTI